MVVGDIHGQFLDLLKILSLIPPMESSDMNILFLGDYVDRGPQGFEVFGLIMALKLKFPKRIVMLRGNH